MKGNKGGAINQHKKLAMGLNPKVKKGASPTPLKNGGMVKKGGGKKGC